VTSDRLEQNNRDDNDMLVAPKPLDLADAAAIFLSRNGKPA
jgi:hypothetical protein